MAVNLRGNLSKDKYANLMSTRSYTRDLLNVVDELKSAGTGVIDPIPFSVRNRINEQTRRMMMKPYPRPIDNQFYKLNTRGRLTESESLKWYLQNIINKDALLPPKVKSIMKRSIKTIHFPIYRKNLNNSEIRFLDALRTNVGGRKMKNNRNRRVNLERAIRTPVP